MAIRKSTLDKYLIQLRRISEHREAHAEANIRRIYKQLLRETQGMLGVEYAQYAQAGRLTYGDLHMAGRYARFMEEVTWKLDGLTEQAVKEIRDTVEAVYKLNFDGFSNAVRGRAPPEIRQILRDIPQVRPDQIRMAVQNPVSGLTLSDTLEARRQSIIYDIKKQVNVGLMQGDRYETVARRIAGNLDDDYTKSVRVSRTETHRVREAGLSDCAADIQDAIVLGESGMALIKIWRDVSDEKVRDDHRPHDGVSGQVRLVGEKFDLPGGAKALYPGGSGVAKQDINCRCYLSYDLITLEEYKKLIAA